MQPYVVRRGQAKENIIGWLRKVTGAQAQIDAANANEAATSAAAKATAAANIKQSQDAAMAAASEQQQVAARQVADDAASAAVSAPLASADVQLDAPTDGSAAAAAAAKRKKFGTGVYQSGVSI